MNTSHLPKHILLVEDTSSYVDLILEALEENLVPHHLHSVKNGEEALNFLYHKENYVNAPCPSLILLDLNLPKIQGQELLAILKADDHLKLIPVVIFSTSAAEDDILRCYALHANCYITKPADLDQFFQVIHDIVTFWLGVVKLPPI